MKKFIHAWNKASLIKRILIGMLIGGTLGLTLPNIFRNWPARRSLCWWPQSHRTDSGLCPRCQCPFPTSKGAR